MTARRRDYPPPANPIKAEAMTKMPPLRPYLLRLCASSLMLLPLLAACNAAEPAAVDTPLPRNNGIRRGMHGTPPIGV